MIHTEYSEYRENTQPTDDIKKCIANFMHKNCNTNTTMDRCFDDIMKHLNHNNLSEVYNSPIFKDFCKENNYNNILRYEITLLKDKGPRGVEWFSGLDINNILSRYEELYNPEGISGGCDNQIFFNCKCNKYPLETDRRILRSFSYNTRDFFHRSTDLRDFDICNGLKKYNCFACVLNTDVCTGYGIHWFSIFIHKNNENIVSMECFDSSGEKMLPEVKEYFEYLCSCLRKKNIQCFYTQVTTRRNQYDNHSCGPYSLYYIKARLEGVPWNYFKDFIIGDSNMRKFRQHLFRIC